MTSRSRADLFGRMGGWLVDCFSGPGGICTSIYPHSHCLLLTLNGIGILPGFALLNVFCIYRFAQQFASRGMIVSCVISQYRTTLEVFCETSIDYFAGRLSVLMTTPTSGCASLFKF